MASRRRPLRDDGRGTTAHTLSVERGGIPLTINIVIGKNRQSLARSVSAGLEDRAAAVAMSVEDETAIFGAARLVGTEPCLARLAAGDEVA